MPDTFIKIASVTVGSGGAANIEFTSIPSTYTDLCVKVSARADSGTISQELRLRFNSDSGANYNWRRIYGTGGAVASQSGSGIGAPYTSFILAGGVNGSTSTATTQGNSEIYVPNYSGSNYKSTSSDSVTENNATEAYTFLTAGIWNSTSAINSINLALPSGNFVQYSTATLYGIKNS